MPHPGAANEIESRLLLKAGTGLRRDIPSRPATKMRDENSAVKYTNTLLPSDIYASAHYFSCDRLCLYALRGLIVGHSV